MLASDLKSGRHCASVTAHGCMLPQSPQNYSNEPSRRFRSERKFGTLHVQVLPPWLTTVLLAALLLLLSSKLVHRGVLTYRSETKARRAAAADAEQTSALEAPLLNEGAQSSAAATCNLSQLVT